MLKRLERGKLYWCPGSHLIIYPTAEKASHVPVDGRGSQWAVRWSASSASAGADYWSGQLDCRVRFSQTSDIFLFLGEKQIRDRKYLRFLFGEFEGWVIYSDELNILPTNLGVPINLE